MDDYLKLFVEETSWYNEIVLGTMLPEKWWSPLPHLCRGWLRAYIGATLIYLLTGFLWCFYIYYLKRNAYVPEDEIPSNRAMVLHIKVAMKAMPWYCVLPIMSEYMIEHGWTKCFQRTSDVGLVSYIVYLIIYLVIVEFLTYWIHRGLHDIKPLYKYLHATHHIYNNHNTLSPFAGFAFHPLDGTLLMLPHFIAPFIVPMHFRTHMVLVFMDAFWAANIHDCIHGKYKWPFLGAGYHTVHHTTYRHNYGQYTIWMDSIFGTLREPIQHEAKKI